MTDDELIRRRVIYQGRVQGVGFRATVASIARRRPVAGYVRNLPDGTVEVVVEAQPAELNRFLADISTAMTGYIVAISTEGVPREEEFRGFSIRR